MPVEASGKQPASRRSNRRMFGRLLITACVVILIGFGLMARSRYKRYLAEVDRLRQQDAAAVAYLLERGAELSTLDDEPSWVGRETSQASEVQFVGMSKPYLIDDDFIAALLQLRNLKVFSVWNASDGHCLARDFPPDSPGLQMKEFPLNDQHMNRLFQLPKLEELHLERTMVTDSGLMAWASHPRIKFIGVGGTRVTDVGLTAFAAASPRAHAYKLRDGQSYYRGAGEFRSSGGAYDVRLVTLLPWVRKAHAEGGRHHGQALPETNIRNADLKLAREIRGLEHLDVVGAIHVTDEGLEHLQGLPCLKSVSLDDSDVTAAGIKTLRESYEREGRQLRVSGGGREEYDGYAMGNLRAKGAKLLTITSERPLEFHDATRAAEVQLVLMGQPRYVLTIALERLRNLRILSIWGEGDEHRCFFPPDDMHDFAPPVQMNDHDLKALAKLERLEELHLENCSVTNDGLMAWVSHSNIKTIGVGGTRITEAGLAAFSVACPHVRVYRLQLGQFYSRQLGRFACDPGAYDLRLASALPWVREIAVRAGKDVPKIAVRDEDLRLARELPYLETLSLSGAEQITNAGLQHLKGLPCLESIDLTGSAITAADAAELKESYRQLGRNINVILESAGG